MTRHQYGIFALVSQTLFRGETSGGVADCPAIKLSIRGISGQEKREWYAKGDAGAKGGEKGKPGGTYH